MSPFILEEGWFLLYSVLLGIGITFVYDCLRICRRVVAHGVFWVSLEDMVYWIFVSCCVFYLLYCENNGVLRWFAVMGTALGMFLFKKTLSPFWVRYASSGGCACGPSGLSGALPGKKRRSWTESSVRPRVF